jgi:hypothetical protein
MPDTEEVLDPIARRNATAYRILAMVSQDRMAHAVLLAELETSGIVEENTASSRLRRHLFGKNRARTLQERKAEQEKGNANILNALVTTLGVAVTLFLIGRMMDEEENPLDPDAPKPTMMERARRLLGKSEPDAATATAESIQVAPQSAGQITTSPLLGKEQLTAIRTGKASDSVRAAIKEGSAKAGADSTLVYAFAGAESTFRTNASASTSSAQGLLQFTGSTWDYMMKLYPSLKYTREDRNDPVKASHVAGLYINSISKTLTRLLGRKPSYGETYMGYFLGPTGASNFLQALQKDPKAIGAELFPKAAAANANVFYEGGNRAKPLSLAQILAKMEGKIISYALEADGKTKVSAGANLQAPPVSPNATATSTAPTTGSAISAQSLPDQNKAVATQISPAVALPTADITNKRMQADKVQPQTTAANDPKATPGVGVNGSQSHPTDTASTPIKGRDGRFYRIS